MPQDSIFTTKSPAPPPPSPALLAALAPLRAYRAAHPRLTRATLPSMTPEQFRARADAWDHLYMQAQTDQRRAESILAQEQDAAWLKAQGVAA